MIRKRHLFARNAVAILAATPLLWIAPSVNAQSSSPSYQESRTSPNSDITRQELARFDQFLDSHQEIAEQLRDSRTADFLAGPSRRARGDKRKPELFHEARKPL